MEVNGWSGAGTGTALPSPPPHGWNFTCVDRFGGDLQCSAYGQTNCYSMDLRNTVTHEVGHFIGLAHVGDQTATMYSRSTIGQQAMRTLAADDQDGLCDIYPAAGATLTCVAGPITADEEDGGCGSAGGAGLLGALLAGLALAGSNIRPRRRSRSDLGPAAPHRPRSSG
jgi:hypothetical protein